MVAFHEGKGFWRVFPYLWNHTIIINGPLWFAQALLIFSLGYCAWRASIRRTSHPTPLAPQSQFQHYRWWLLSALGRWCCQRSRSVNSFLQAKNVIGLQLGYFASYTFSSPSVSQHGAMIGSASSMEERAPVDNRARHRVAHSAHRHRFANKYYGPGKASFGGGLTWPAILYAFWEPFVAWGLIAAWLLFARAYMNKPSQFWSWLNRRAYAVYIIHPLVLVGISLLLHPWVAPALAQVRRHRNAYLHRNVAHRRSARAHSRRATHCLALALS